MNMTAQQGLGLVWLLEHESGRDFFLATPNGSPWIHVDFPTGPDKYAIWNSTGSVYKLERESGLDVVPDDPIYTPPPYTALEGSRRLAEENERLGDLIDKLVNLMLTVPDDIPDGWFLPEVLRDDIERIRPGLVARLEDVRRIREAADA